MHAAITRWVRRHERLGLTGFVVLVIVVSVYVSASAFAGASGSLQAAILAAAALGLLAAVIHQVVLWRRGGLVLSAEERQRRRARADAGDASAWAGVGVLAFVLTAYFADAAAVLFALVAGLFVGYAPVLLWTAFVVLPGDREARQDDGAASSPG